MSLEFQFVVLALANFRLAHRLACYNLFTYSDVATAGAVVPISLKEYSRLNALPFNVLLAVVREARPDIDIAYISLNHGGYFYVVGQTDNVLVRNRANKVYLAPKSG